ncbi:MAG TPA: hypothetical protein VMC06_15090, partial [Opitutaceae bacterium]|nr:hypothetical protein [Opitutaceae bacterium]
MNDANLDTCSRILRRVAIASLALGAGRLAFAQTPAATTENVVELPQFTITETQANRYQPQSALSASRVAMPILD